MNGLRRRQSNNLQLGGIKLNHLAHNLHTVWYEYEPVAEPENIYKGGQVLLKQVGEGQSVEK